MLFVLARVPFLAAFSVGVGLCLVFIVPLSELITTTGLISFCCNFVQVDAGDGANHRHQPKTRDNYTFSNWHPEAVSYRRCKPRTISASPSLTPPPSSSLLLLLMLLWSSLASCGGASPVLVPTVLVSGCMHFLLVRLSFFVVFGVVVVGSFAILLLLLSELCLVFFLTTSLTSLRQWHAGDVTAHAETVPTIATTCRNKCVTTTLLK